MKGMSEEQLSDLRDDLEAIVQKHRIPGMLWTLVLEGEQTATGQECLVSHCNVVCLNSKSLIAATKLMARKVDKALIGCMEETQRAADAGGRIN